MKKEVPAPLIWTIVVVAVLAIGAVVWATQFRSGPQVKSEDLPKEFFEDPDPQRLTDPKTGEMIRRQPN